MHDLTLDTASAGQRAFVRLRVAVPDVVSAAERLDLPLVPLNVREGNPTALWIGPDSWFLTSAEQSATTIIERIDGLLADPIVYNATDASDALTCFEVYGANARRLLAMGSGIDFDERAFSPGRCVRTRLAKVAAVIHYVAADRFELIVDRTVAHYLEEWLRRSALDARV